MHLIVALGASGRRTRLTCPDGGLCIDDDYLVTGDPLTGSGKGMSEDENWTVSSVGLCCCR